MSRKRMGEVLKKKYVYYFMLKQKLKYLYYSCMAEICNCIIFIVNNLVNIGFPYKKLPEKVHLYGRTLAPGFDSGH